MIHHPRPASVRSPGRGRLLGRALLPGWLALAVLTAAPLRGRPAQTPDLPPAAAGPVEFARDIRPILERSCLRCHGPERPRSGLRLDQRAFALKGGKHGPALVPGDSAASPLIRYVARLPEVEDFWMPPEGKGPPLTREDVALLRAWIDAQAPWDDTPIPRFSVEVTTSAGWTGVQGNRAKFRELTWGPEGWNGGIERLVFEEQADDRTRLTAEGRLLRDDYRLSLNLARRDLGFVRAGVEQYRKYYGDSGGETQAAVPSVFQLGRDLAIDLGRAWLDLGLTLPNGLRLVLGYERQVREGDKTLSSWSPVAVGAAYQDLYPTFKSLDEEAHIFKFNLTHDLWGWRLEDDFRAEFGSSRTSRTNTALVPPESDSVMFDRVQERQHWFQAANAFRAEREFQPWLLGSAGYLYSRYDGDGAFGLDEAQLGGAPMYPRRWRSPSFVLEQQAHVGNANAQLGPWSGWSAALGVQGEWNRRLGLGDASFDYEQPDGTFLVFPVTQHTDTHRGTLAEYAAMRYTRIPFTVLFAEGRLQQESIGHFEDQPGGDTPLRQDTDAGSQVRDVRLGFNTSPWSRVSLATHYRRVERRTAYDHQVDVIPTTFGDFPNGGYPAFLRAHDVDTDEVAARLTVRPAAWLKTSVSYQWIATASFTLTDEVPGGITPLGRLLAGDSERHVYGFQAGFSPGRRVRFHAAYSFLDSRSVTAAHDTPGVAPYRGQTHSVAAGGTYYWNEKTDLLANCVFSRGDYRPSMSAGSPAWGADYYQHALTAGLRRRLSKLVAATLRYGFYLYEEPASGHANDYTAHAVFLSLNVRWP